VFITLFVMSASVPAAFRKAFADAVDKWKIDGEGGLKGYYLHSPSGRLFSWDQPKGVLYEYDINSGTCKPIWNAQNAAENAEIWTLLPLPPTDPAASNAAQPQEELPSIQVAIPEGATPGQILQVTTPEGTEVQFVVPPDAITGQMFQIHYTPPADFLLLHILENKIEDVTQLIREITFFASKCGLTAANLVELKKLPYEGQSYVERNFQNQKLSISEFLKKVHDDRPWEQEFRVLRVDSAGAIIGSHLPEFANIPGIAQAQCHITAQKDQSGRIRWYVRDLDSATGSFLEGRAVTNKEPGCILRSNQVLDLGNQAEMVVEIHEVDATGASTTAGNLDLNSFRRTEGFREVIEDLRERKRKRKEDYSDRAEARRIRVDQTKGAAVARLEEQSFRNREKLIQAEEDKLNEEEGRTVKKHQREAGMDEDGTFLGAKTDSGKGGIGFTDPAADFHTAKSMSRRDKANFKTQKRFEQIEKKK